MAKSIQSLNDAIFKNYLKEALAGRQAGRQRQYLCTLQAVQRKDYHVVQGKIIMKKWKNVGDFKKSSPKLLGQFQ